jgi:dynein heavy chain
MFPSLVNCCVIDWFLPWPQEALEDVATRFLSKIEELDERDGVVKICVDM